MSGLDSIYAMLATPKRATSDKKRRVERVNTTSAISADSHEAPQSQLPPVNTQRKHTAASQIRDDKDITDDDAPLKQKAKPHQIDIEI